MRGKTPEDLKQRKDEILECFKDADESKKKFITPLVDEFVYLENELAGLRNLPHLRVHPKNPAKQEITPAGKQYKEYWQSYLNAYKVLQKELYAEGLNHGSDLLEKLAAFDTEYR